jgi:hypothetical protein
MNVEENQPRLSVRVDYYSDGTRILTSVVSGPKLIEEISSDTGIPLGRCRARIDELMDVGLLEVEHDSDLYGHELVRYRRPSRPTAVIS